MSLLTASCSDNESMDVTDLHSPIAVHATLSSDRVVTRATTNAFASDDELMVYFQHVVTSNDETTASTAKMAKFNYATGDMPTGLYWDDFSTTDNDLRTAGHALRSYYGYCLNGGKAATALDEATGEMGWSVPADQSAVNLQQSDLIWSGTQTGMTYDHATTRKSFTVPFSHAMSEVTVTLTAGKGFDTDETFANTSIVLNKMNTTGSFTAPTLTVEGATPENVTMQHKGNNFTALVVPGTTLTSGDLFATINDADSNKYTVKLDDKVIGNWQSGLDDGKMKSGVNYHLDITLDKQPIVTAATLADWSTVSATGTGEIQFANDVTAKDLYGAFKADGASYDIYLSKDGKTFGGKSTTTTYADNEWSYSPDLYWPNGSTKYYFRALASYDGTKMKPTTTKVSQGSDIVWATSGDAAIAPRTGAVPLNFNHVMSKVTVKLATTEGADAVDLDGATWTISPVATSATVDVATGSITPDEATGKVSSNTIVVPQTIGNDVILKITLKDGTSYNLQLNNCLDAGSKESSNVIFEWKSGESYTYNILLKKHAAIFCAFLQKWGETTGKGEATLNWD